MCKRGFKECYNEFDVFDAIDEAMCQKCHKYVECKQHYKDLNEDEERCIQIEKMVQCIYNSFRERKFE